MRGAWAADNGQRTDGQNRKCRSFGQRQKQKQRAGIFIGYAAVAGSWGTPETPESLQLKLKTYKIESN